MIKEMLFALLGGLGFFFFGMQLMSDGLKKVSGEKLKTFLHSATKIPIVGIFVGALVTCLIQSSSATTVMVVGFVNAGLLALRQAIAVVMGANIGTTFTAWIVSSMSVFKVTSYALPAIGIGFLLMKLGRSRRARSMGQVMLGFGLLFTGLAFLKDAFAPLQHSVYVKDLFATFSHNPILGILTGIIFTVLLQSSSATIAIVQMLAFSGVIGFEAAIPIVLGDNIGTTITAQMAAMGTNLNARRTAMSHMLFNVIGTAYMIIFLYTGLFSKAIYLIIPGEISVMSIMFYIAFAHSFFNVINTIVFLPLIGWLEKISIILVPKKEGSIEPGTQYLEKHLLETPAVALEQIRNETVYMLHLANKSVSIAVESFIKNTNGAEKKVAEMEEAIDNLQSEITQYIVELSQKGLAAYEDEQLPVLIHNVNDIERIGDHSENIVDLAERRIEGRLRMSDKAINDIKAMWNEVSGMLADTEQILKTNDVEHAGNILSHEERVNLFQKELKDGHVDRLNNKECDLKSGVIFLDFVDNLEKIGDHLTNIAQGVMSNMRWKGLPRNHPEE